MRALVYGDSLTWEAQGLAQFFKPSNVSLEIHGVYGSAPCAALDTLIADIARFQPTVVVLAYSGNPGLSGSGFTSPCMGNIQDPQAVAAKYQADALAIRAAVLDHGAHLTLVTSPAPGLFSPGDQDPARWAAVRTMWRAFGPQYGVPVVDGGWDIAPNDTYTRTMPCLFFESCDETGPPYNAPAGQVVVRATDMTHFCPVPYWPDLLGQPACPVQDSGSMRFAFHLLSAAQQ